MSRVRRLSIRGIRNFGDQQDLPSIQFSRPLTLILGPNGTGKTTIIECLKYATTGEFPPGSDKGKSFIHDPSLSKAASVRGLVKAEIVDCHDDILTISRTIESSVFETRSKFKTLDNTLSRTNKKTGKTLAISNRCADVDAEIVLAMGVSKPILNYVIFCHQEEFNWPFEDGKKLKERFDQIFDTKTYNKALESLNKFSKDLQSEIRALKAEKQTEQATVLEVENKEKKQKNLKTRLEESIQKVQETEARLEPINQRIIEIQNLEKQYQKMKIEQEHKKMEYSLVKKQVDNLKENIREIFEGTIEELHEEVASYQSILSEKNNEVSKLDEELKHVTKEENNLANILADQRVKVGTLRQQVQDHEKRVVQRNKVLNEALIASDFLAIESDVAESDIAVFMKKLDEKIRDLKQMLEEKRLEQDRDEKRLQREVDLSRGEKSKVESEISLKENEMTDTREEGSKIRDRVEQAGTAAKKLSIIDAKLQQANSKIDSLTKSLDVDEVKAKIQEDTHKQNKVEINLNQVDEEVASLHRHSSLQAELELHKNSLNVKEKEIQKFNQKHGDALKELLDTENLPQGRLKNSFDKAQQTLVEKIKTLNASIQSEQHRAARWEITIKNYEQELEKRSSELKSDKAKISAMCAYEDYEETVLLVSKTVKDLQEKKGMFAYESVAYKQYMKQLKENNPCCPLCHRGFQGAETVDELITEMKKQMEKHPERLKSYEVELKMQQRKYDSLQQLKPIVEKVEQLENVELKRLRDKLKETKSKLVDTQKSIERYQELITEPEGKLAACKDMIGDIVLWDRHADEVMKLESTIAELQSRMKSAGVQSERTIQEAQTERDNLRKMLKQLREHLATSQKTLSTYNEKLQHAREERNKLFEEQLKTQSEMQNLKQLRDKQEELYTKEVSLETSIRNLRHKLVTADDQLDQAVRRLEKMKKEHRTDQENDRRGLEDSERKLFEFKKIQSDIDAFIRRNVIETLKIAEEKMNSFENTGEKLKERKSALEKKINNVKAEASQQDLRKRDLTDNIALRQKQTEAETVQQQIIEIREALKTLNYDTTAKELRRLHEQRERLFREKNMTIGNQEELERGIEQLQEELRNETNRLARTRLRNKVTELRVQEETIINLKAYSKALDDAMIQYHEERMSTVNSIMKKMWSLIYKGTDTTSIQIRTEATGNVGDKRRTYNYKLIQEKHGIEMDMKGRCSAGQKVLASIIIRMALAETFCKDCGVLALDEPTTNLDEENTNSLADAITTVVGMRSKHQKNFQLIVISHDEPFLLKLAKLNNNKGFYELYRFTDGLTGIRHCSMVDQPSKYTRDEDDSSDDDVIEVPRKRQRSSDDELPSVSNASARKKVQPSTSRYTDDSPSTRRR